MLAVPFGSLLVGGQMKAFFAVFLEFREGKIVRQRNYDCFEAWSRWWAMGKYEGTVTEWAFVVPFSHCLGKCK